MKAKADKSAPKILFVIGQLTLGGAERRLMDLQEFLSNNGYDVKIANLSGETVSSNLNNNSEKQSRKSFAKLKFLINEIRNFNPDIVHSFDLQSGIYAKVALKYLRVKAVFISGYGASDINFYRKLHPLLKRKFFQPDLYVCNSNKGALSLKSILPDKNITIKVISNGLNTARFINPVKEIPFWANAKNLIGYIGKFDNIKHGERIVEIAQEFKNENIDVNFVLIGSGPYFESAKKTVDSDDYLKKHVTLLGLVDNAAQFIKYFKIGVLCSDSEGLPNVILEFMANKIPSISTIAGDVQEVLDNGNCGILIESYDKVQFKNAILNLLNDSKLYNTLAENSQKRFIEHYTIDKSSAEYMKLYSEILNKY